MERERDKIERQHRVKDVFLSHTSSSSTRIWCLTLKSSKSEPVPECFDSRTGDHDDEKEGDLDGDKDNNEGGEDEIKKNAEEGEDDSWSWRWKTRWFR